MKNMNAQRWGTLLLGALVGVFVALGLWSLGDLGASSTPAAADTGLSTQVAAAATVWEDKITPFLSQKASLELAPADEVHVANAPDIPPPITRTDQRIVEVHFDVVENVATIDPQTGVEFETWGYKIAGDDTPVIGTPGPVIRARVGDVFRFTVTNPPTNTHPHNVDFHAVTGQGGGARRRGPSPTPTPTACTAESWSPPKSRFPPPTRSSTSFSPSTTPTRSNPA